MPCRSGSQSDVVASSWNSLARIPSADLDAQLSEVSNTYNNDKVLDDALAKLNQAQDSARGLAADLRIKLPPVPLQRAKRLRTDCSSGEHPGRKAVDHSWCLSMIRGENRHDSGSSSMDSLDVASLIQCCDSLASMPTSEDDETSPCATPVANQEGKRKRFDTFHLEDLGVSLFGVATVQDLDDCMLK